MNASAHIPGGTFQITLANASQYVIMGLFYVVVARTGVLTEADIGILSISSFLAATFSLLTGLALPTALTKFVAEKLGENRKEDAMAIQKTVTRIVLTTSLAGFAIVALSSKLLSQYLWNTSEYAILIILTLVYAFLSNLKTLYSSSLQALSLFGSMATVTLIFIITSRITAVVLAFFHMRISGVLIGYVCGSFIAVTAAMNFLRGKLPKTTENMPLKPLFHFSLPLFFTALTLLVLNWADVVIITSITNDYSLTGVYYIVIRSVSVLSILWVPMTTTIFPTLSTHHGLKEPERISSILKAASRYLVYIILPGCIGLAIIAPTALTFFYGAGYGKGAILLAILSIATIVTALYSLFATALTATGKTGQILKINVISAVSTILMLLALVPLLEATGAALTRAAIQVLSLALAVFALRKEIKVQLDKEALWKSALASTAMVSVLLALELIISPKLVTTQTLITEILVGVAIYTIALYILKALKNQDFKLLKLALPKPLTKYINTLENIMVR